MKSVLLAALLCLLSLSVFGQNQALMVDTNWTIVQTNTNTITFRQAIGFGTNTANQAAVRTNLGFTAVGNSVATATNTTAAQNAIGISATNILSVSNIDIGAFEAGTDRGFVGRDAEGRLILRGTNVSTATPAFYGWDGFNHTAFSAETARTNLGLGWSALTNTNADNFEAALFPATNAAPTNTTNVAGWVDLRVGTNTFKLPLYQ